MARRLKTRGPHPPLSALVLPPVGALLLILLLAHRETRELPGLRAERDRDQAAIALLQARQTDPRHSAAAPVPTGLLDPAKIDWARVARLWSGLPHAEPGGGLTEMDGFRLRSQIFTWTGEQLLAALDRIGKGDIPQAGQGMSSQLEVALAVRDPAALLARVDTWPSYQLSFADSKVGTALATLAASDPAAARAWLDRQFDSGKVDSALSVGHSSYAACLIAALATSDYAAASQRMAAYSPEIRAQILSGFRGDDSHLDAFIRLSREYLPPGSVPAPLSDSSSLGIVYRGLNANSAMLDRIAATPAERLAFAGQIAASPFAEFLSNRDLKESDLGELHAWMTRQAPDQADELTAKAMAAAITDPTTGENSPTATDLMLKYDADGSHHLLAPFLKQLIAAGRTSIAAPLIDKIADPVQRQEIRNSLR